MGKKMKNAPVYFTIAQARFNPILDIETYVPRIQERLRKKKFTDAGKLVRASFIFPPSASGEESNPQPTVGQKQSYTFSNMERTSGFVLDENALTFHTTKYDTFENFSDSFLTGLKIVHDLIGLDFVDRIGLRAAK